MLLCVVFAAIITKGLILRISFYGLRHSLLVLVCQPCNLSVSDIMFRLVHPLCNAYTQTQIFRVL